VATAEADVSVYRVNPHEWWIARSLDEAISAAAALRGVHAADVVDELSPPFRLTDDHLDSTVINHGGSVLPLSLVLGRMLDSGVKLPVLFGTIP